MTEPAGAPPLKTALIVSVGGSRTPVEHVLRRLRPAELLLVVSEESRGQAEEILQGLDFRPQYSFLQFSDPQDLDRCFREVHGALGSWVASRGLDPDVVTVDITGGTKPMSASLALAACEYFRHFTYTGGERAGLGTVITGMESPIETCNPWDSLALRDTSLARALLGGFHAEAAAEVLRGAAARATKRKAELALLAAFADLLARADRFDFANLVRDLYPLQAGLALLVGDLDRLRDHWSALAGEARPDACVHPATIAELVANAARRAHQRRYDDAIARFYRAAELAAQDELYRVFPRAQTGKLPADSVPESHQAIFHERLDKYLFTDKKGSLYRLPFEGCLIALELSGLAEAARASRRLGALAPEMELRNTSILAHGVRPTSSADYTRFRVAISNAFPPLAAPDWPAFHL